MRSVETLKDGLLAIDVGNTSTLFGYYEDGLLKKRARLSTRSIGPKALRSLARRFPMQKIQAAAIASVVPKTSRVLKTHIPRIFKVKALLIGRDIAAPIPNKYKNPREVGIDRLMNAVAAFKKYKTEMIIVDFGTAITFDVVSKKGEYLGGVIAPGIDISLEALFQKAALLPKIRLMHPKHLMGRDTVESIRVGCTYGIGGLCDRIIEALKKQYSLHPQVIATGGYARFMQRYCHGIKKIDTDLTLDGIRWTYSSHLRKNT